MNSTAMEELVEEPADTSDGIVKTMLIFAGVCTFVFTALYLMFYCRAKKNNEVRRERNNSDENSERTELENPRPPPKPKFTQPKEEREPQPGDPIYDQFLIGGTISLGVIMLIGATIVLVMSLVDQSKYSGADTGDFQLLLGATGTTTTDSGGHCRVRSSISYIYKEKRLNALNTICVEEWKYNVHVPPTGGSDDSEEEAFFVSAPLSLDSCRGKCEDCIRMNRLFGQDYYAGVDPLVGGTYIPSSSSNSSTDQTEVKVECWAPVVPVDELSDFYDCGTQRAENGTCFLLKDTAILLKDEENSSQISLISAYSCYAGGIVLLLVAGFFIYRNKQVREAAELDRDTAVPAGETEADAGGKSKIVDVESTEPPMQVEEGTQKVEEDTEKNQSLMRTEIEHQEKPSEEVSPADEE